MALNFNPPEWLIQQYMARKSPGQEASEAVQGGLNTYVTAQQQQATNTLAQEDRDLKLATALSQNGQDVTDNLAKIKAARTAPQPAGTSIIDRAKAFFTGSNTGKSPDASTPASADPSAMPQATPTMGALQNQINLAPQMATPSPDSFQPPTASTGTAPAPLQADPLMQEYLKDPAAYKRQHGEAGITKLKTQGELDKLLTDKTKGPLIPVTKEEALAKKSFDPSKEIMVEPPAPRLDLSTKQDQFNQTEWDKIVKETNPLTASARTTLGMASKANFQADRALVTLSKPVVTVQEAGNAMADIAAIYQTGSPTQYGMSHQEYSTLYGKIQSALQTVTGNPQDALPDKIKQRLVGVLHDMKQTNGLVLKQQLDFTEKSKKRIIDKFPDEWKGIRATLEDNPDQGSSIPATGPHGASVSQNGHTYNWNQNTGQYE